MAVAVWKERPDAVILPDPELFVIGALVARIRGIKAVADIHEDYSRAAYGRKWIPGWLKPIFAALAGVNDWLARRSAHVVVVAAPELSDADSVLVMNTPNPDDFIVPDETVDTPTVVYVGDVTEARGALSIAELARRMSHNLSSPAAWPTPRHGKRLAGRSAGYPCSPRSLPIGTLWPPNSGSTARPVSRRL
jgi:hypothetical protein